MSEALKHRVPPETPLLPFYSIGKYPTSIGLKPYKKGLANPGASASIFERNRRANIEQNIKPIIQDQFEPSNYKPEHYMKPFLTQDQRKDIDTSGIQQAKVFNRRQAALEHKMRIQATAAFEVNKEEFNKHRRHASLDQSTLSSFGNSIKEKQIPEQQNNISQNENKFYRSKKVLYKPEAEITKYYQYSTPDYMRVTDLKQDRQSRRTNSITVLSRNNGWLTVDPLSMSRRNAFEIRNQSNKTHDQSINPEWMVSSSFIDEERLKLFKAQPLVKQNTREKSCRVIMADSNRPEKSIFNIGQVRHNTFYKPPSGDFRMMPSRLIKWDEDIGRQRFDKPVTMKVGQ